MANKRSLKKQIRYICGDLAGECIFAREIIPDVDREKANEIIIEIAALQEDTLKKATFAFDKTACDFETRHEYRAARRAYFHSAYKTLTEGFNAKVETILKAMNGLLTKEQREAQKKAAAE